MVLHNNQKTNKLRGWICFFAVCLIGLSSCGNMTGRSSGGNDAQGAENGDGQNPISSNPEDDSIVLGLSDNSIFKLKRAKVLQNDLSVALSLSKEELCTELGDLDCIEEVHKLPLGDTSAYIDTIYSPIEQAIGPTIAIMDRIATSACGKRVEIDLEDPANAHYFNFDQSQTNLNSNLKEKLRASTTKLIQNAYLREPSTDELDDFVELYQTIQAAGISDPVTAWSQASCISMFTSLEFLFY